MISPDYLSEGSIVSQYSEGVLHYQVQPRYKVLSHSEYTLGVSETVYKIARQIFGSDKEYLWTIIADLNPHKRVEEWVAGDVILIPTEVVERRNEVTDNRL